MFPEHKIVARVHDSTHSISNEICSAFLVAGHFISLFSEQYVAFDVATTNLFNEFMAPPHFSLNGRVRLVCLPVLFSLCLEQLVGSFYGG